MPSGFAHRPEADHAMERSPNNTNTGNRQDEFWRDARNEGFFSYRMTTQGQADLNLMVRYWGAERGDRKFDIYIDDQKLATVDNTNKWNQQRFIDMEYPIPASILAGKTTVRVRFQASQGYAVSSIHYIRLVKK